MDIGESLRKVAREMTLRWRNADRYLLERKIIPSIKGMRVLFVGCSHYTASYPKKFSGNELKTIDINPLVARYGSRNHVVGDISLASKYFNKNYFDVVFLTGVLGYGVDSKVSAEKTFVECSKILKKGGKLIIQWSDNPGRNNVELKELKSLRLFERSSMFGLPKIIVNKKGKKTRVWEFFVKK